MTVRGVASLLREGKVIDRDAGNVFQIGDGVVTEVTEFFEDTGESDAFWS